MTVEIKDWVDATRPMRSAVHEALHRLREAIEPAPRITQPSLMAPYVDDELHTRVEQALEA